MFKYVKICIKKAVEIAKISLKLSWQNYGGPLGIILILILYIGKYISLFKLIMITP